MSAQKSYSAIELLYDALPPSLDALDGLHSFRVDQLTDTLWHVKVYGRYVTAFKKERNALHWLAMFILKVSTLPQHEKEP